MLLSATTTMATATTTSSEQRQQQPQIAFQTQSSRTIDDNGDRVHINSSGRGSVSGGAARIPSGHDHYNYIELDQVAADNDAVVQTSPNNYQRLDPSRQPSAPSAYTSLIPNVPAVSQNANNAEPGRANYEALDPTRLNEPLCTPVLHKPQDRVHTTT